MLVAGEGFPYTPLVETDKHLIISFCGGEPVEPTYFREFLRVSGQPTLGNALVQTFFDDVTWRSINALGMHDSSVARASNRGVLFYAGVLREINNVGVIPYAEPVMGEIGSADGKNFALTSYQRIQEEAPTFCAFAHELRDAMEAEDNRLYQAVLVGAGSVHIAVMDSLARMQDTTTLDNAHPELADLEELFGTFPNE